MSCHVPHHCTRPECRRYDRLLLLDAPPATPLRTSQYLDTCHPTVSCTGANTGVCTTAQSRHIKPTDERRSSPEGYGSSTKRAFLAASCPQQITRRATSLSSRS